MRLARQVITGIVIAAALAVIFLSVYQISGTRAADDAPPPNNATTSELDERSRQLQERLDRSNERINDMENIIIILLGITGLYTLVFILTADFNARAVRRQVDLAMSGVKEQIGLSMDQLSRIQDETRDALRAEVHDAAKRLDEHAHEVIRQLRGEGVVPVSPEIVHQLETVDQRITTIAQNGASSELAQEVLHYEGALPAIELLHSRYVGPQLGRIYRGLAGYYRKTDGDRSHFYLNRSAALAPEDFETANELGFLALDSQKPPDYRSARRYFEASLSAQPDQQRAKYGLALIAKAAGDLETALGLLDGAIQSEHWETGVDFKKTALVHYALACVLARRGHEAPPGYRAQYLIRATEHLQEAFAYPSPKLEELLSRDTEDDGDLAVLANTTPYDNAINDLLLNLSVGAA